jgi:hypothetical protein
MRSMFALLRLVVWLKRLALAVERLDARDQMRYERDYPPVGVDPPGRRKMVIDKPTAQDRQEMRWKKQEEQMLQGQDEL